MCVCVCVCRLRLADGRVVLMDLRSGTSPSVRRELVVEANVARDGPSGATVVTPGAAEGGPGLLFRRAGAIVSIMNHTNGHAVGTQQLPQPPDASAPTDAR